jgi:mannose-1-phosphate guanylyltransferase
MAEKYALIMAGGAGTRLWPLSREKRPKPVLPLVEESRSMFQIAVERLSPLFPPGRVLVVANAELTAILQEQAPEIPAENFIIEPVGRDTAPAVGLGAIHIRHRDPEAILAVLTADHYLTDEEGFRNALDAACQIAEQDRIVTLGITPDYPATGFGYIERGAITDTLNGIDVFDLKQFVEKPDEERARAFVTSGRYSWNSGMFIWKARRVLSELAVHAPELSASLETLAKAIGTAEYETMLQSIWPTIQKISVDYALMEHISEGINVIPVDIGWSDIGNFEALYDILSDDEGHAVVGHEPVVIDSQRLLVFSQRLVAAVGVEDLVIIDTDDVLLICLRSRAQDVKQLVETLKKNQQNEYT